MSQRLLEVNEEMNELKRELAARYANDRRAYTSAKVEFIESVLEGLRA